MSLARILVILLFVIILIALGLYIYRGRTLSAPQAPPVNPGLLMPGSWTPLTNGIVECDFDSDPAHDPEWLVPYRYDKSTNLPDGIIGGVIFVRQANLVPQNLATPSPYRPSSVLTYKLLPDIYEGKGQGYLGESGITVELAPQATSGPNCEAQEIAVWGKNINADQNRNQRLSIFRWNSSTRTYQGVSFVASGYITATTDVRQYITDFTIADRFDDRNVLCTLQGYQRTANNGAGQPPPFGFTEAPNTLTIDFCYGAPADPAYPEGVVVALLRAPGTPPNDSPGSGFFLDPNVSLPPDLQPLKGPRRPQYQVLAVRNQGSLAPYPAGGAPIPPPPGPAGASNDQWLRSGEQATVQTTLVTPQGQELSVIWKLVSIANTQVATDTRWRITEVTQQ